MQKLNLNLTTASESKFSETQAAMHKIAAGADIFQGQKAMSKKRVKAREETHMLAEATLQLLRKQGGLCRGASLGCRE